MDGLKKNQSKKIVLVSYAGYPYTPSSLMPDNGLANLASVLIHDGCNVKILDYGVVNTIEKLRFKKETALQIQTASKKLLASILNDDACSEEFDHFRKLKQEADVEKYERIRQHIDEVFDELMVQSPRLVALKLWNGDGFYGSGLLADKIKKYDPKIPVIGGGPHTGWNKENVLKAVSSLDAIVVGEGERAILAYTRFLEGNISLSQVPGLIYRSGTSFSKNSPNHISDLDEIPLPIYDPQIYPAMSGNQKMKLFVLDESRGCPYSCHFCTHGELSGRKWRTKSTDRLIDELHYFKTEYGASRFVLAGSDTPYFLLNDLSRRIIDEKLSVMISGFADARTFERVDFSLMKKAGFHALFIGVESGDQRILDEVMNKNVTVSRLEEMIRRTKAANIKIVGSVIHPHPFETEATTKTTLDFLIRNRPDSVPLTMAGLIPGNRWQKEPCHFNFVLSDEFNKEILYHKINWLFPPILGDELPYRINGEAFFESAKKNLLFAKELEKNGLVTNMPHDLLMIAECLGIDPLKFKADAGAMFYFGEADKIQSLVDKFNGGMKE